MRLDVLGRLDQEVRWKLETERLLDKVARGDHGRFIGFYFLFVNFGGDFGSFVCRFDLERRLLLFYGVQQRSLVFSPRFF